MLPLVETALQIVLDAGTVLGQTVVVLGGGAIGLLTTLVLQRAGAALSSSSSRAPGATTWPRHWGQRRWHRTSWATRSAW